MRRTLALILLLMLLAPPLQAQRPGAAERGMAEAEVRRWLELQRAQSAASQPRPLPGDVASRIYERYLDSFTHPLPETYERKRFLRQD